MSHEDAARQPEDAGATAALSDEQIAGIEPLANDLTLWSQDFNAEDGSTLLDAAHSLREMARELQQRRSQPSPPRVEPAPQVAEKHEPCAFCRYISKLVLCPRCGRERDSGIKPLFTEPGAPAPAHRPLAMPDDRSVLVERACAVDDSCISAGKAEAAPANEPVLLTEWQQLQAELAQARAEAEQLRYAFKLEEEKADAQTRELEQLRRERDVLKAALAEEDTYQRGYKRELEAARAALAKCQEEKQRLLDSPFWQ